MHAIVLGAGVAGLAAAAALARHGDVTIVERDESGGSPAARRGVPQGAHQHLLLRRGYLALETLVPGIGIRLRDRGAVPFDAGSDVIWLTPTGWAPRVHSGLEVLGATRGLLEQVLRERALSAPNIELRSGLDWTGLALHGTPPIVSGVRVRAGRSGPEFFLPGDLVVDATGRGSPASKLLTAAGMSPPAETTLKTEMAYASVAVRGAALADGLVGAYVRSAPPTITKGGVLLPVEDGRHLLTLIGPSDEPPPGDWDQVPAYAEGLRSSLLARALEGAQPCGPVVGSRSTANRWRHYERLAKLPSGFLAVGDSLCALNPAYQQGMTLAAIGAEALASVLARGTNPPDIARKTYRLLAPMLRDAWLMATHEHNNASGGHGITRLRQSHLRRVARASTISSRLRREHLDVLHMLARPRRLARPRVLVSVAHAGIVRNSTPTVTGARKRRPAPVLDLPRPRQLTSASPEPPIDVPRRRAVG